MLPSSSWLPDFFSIFGILRLAVGDVEKTWFSPGLMFQCQGFRGRENRGICRTICRENGKENGKYHTGVYWGSIGCIREGI